MFYNVALHYDKGALVHFLLADVTRSNGMNALSRLDDQIADHFNLSELQDLCFKLDINFENLAGSTLNDKTLELVRYCQRHRRLNELLALLSELRPMVDWPEPAGVVPSPKPSPSVGATPKSSIRWLWLLVPLLAVCLISLLAGVLALIWRPWLATTTTPELTPEGIQAETGFDASSAPPPATIAPVTRESNPPIRTTDEGSTAGLEPNTFPTETPFLNLISEDRLVSSPGRSSYPDVLGDLNGGLHLVWWDDTARSGAAGDLFYMYRSASGEWGEIERVTDENEEFVSEYETALRLRIDGVVCVFFGGAAIGLKQTCRENGAWSPPIDMDGWRFGVESDPQIDVDGQPFVVHNSPPSEIQFEDMTLSDGLNGGNNPRFAIDSEGVFHVVWFSDNRLIHRQSSDKGVTWSELEVLTDEVTRPDFIAFSLLADADGQVHLAWNGFDGGHFYRAWSADNGWGQVEKVVEQPENNCTSVDLQSTPIGDLIYTWQGGQGVFVTARPPGDNQSWTSPIQVSSRICRGYGPVMAVLPNGHLFLVYSDVEDDQIDIYGAELVYP